MKLRTFSRIVRDNVIRRSARERYWNISAALGRTRRLMDRSNRAFAGHAVRDHLRFVLGTIRPLEGETRFRARAAAAWLVRAQDATPDRGVSYGYFPCEDDESAWRPSYPETTGYIIPSLLAFADRVDDDEVRRRALEMAEWETQVQMASGAVQGGPLRPSDERSPAAFNTAMVLHGYTAAYRAAGDPRFLAAGRKAADFLLADQDEDGHFRTHGGFVRPRRIHTYLCLSGWALVRFAEDSGEDRYRRAALSAVEAALRQQRPNGWFANNCIANADAPLLHTIGYTLQGILETGALAGREDFVAAVRRGTDPLLDRLSPDGFIHGSFYPDWEPATFSCCLTGSAQLAVVCYRLFEHTGQLRYRAAADRIVNYLKALQDVNSSHPAINGALAGSFPILGRYMTAGFPNWATKYLLDALLFQDALQSACRGGGHREPQQEQQEAAVAC